MPKIKISGQVIIIRQYKSQIRLIIVIVIVLLFYRYLFRLNFVPSASMEPTIAVGDVVLSRTFGLDKIKRNDVIIFNSHNDNNDLFIKRILGMPGDHLILTKENVIINGEVVCDEYMNKYEDLLNVGEYIIPEDCYFVLGDNSKESYDSRYWTSIFVNKKDISAVGMVVIYPWQHIKILGGKK